MKPDFIPGSRSADAEEGRTEFDWPRHAGATDEILRGLESRARRRRHRRLAATGALAAVLALGLLWTQKFTPPVAPETTLAATDVVVHAPERRTLPDGSVVELRDGAQIEIDFSPEFRRVALLRGEAHFAVAKNPARPFIVRADGVEVRAVGTAFAVQVGQSAVEVVVTEGKVAVEKPAPASAAATASAPTPAEPPRLLASLTAGYRVVVEKVGAAPTEVRELAAAEVADRLSWRVPRLEFSGTPLAEVIALFNRHNRTQFVLADAPLGRLRVSGSLRADRVEALVAMVETDFGVRADRSDGRIVLHAAR
ncbi:MAG: FecR domain-containing protein [Opitutae bacterium]|nr:FecR domain-containing protein [Opitutae bacterium]